MEKINTETGEHSGASLCSEIYFILQELNDDSYRRYWFDDTQPANTEKSLDRLERWVKRDMKKHSAHYAHCRHRIIKREETEVSFPNKSIHGGPRKGSGRPTSTKNHHEK